MVIRVQRKRYFHELNINFHELMDNYMVIRVQRKRYFHELNINFS